MSDAHWRLLAPLLPAPAPTGRPRTHELRAIINAILYIVRNGCTWRALPHDLPPWPTVHYYFRKWRHDGTLERVLDELRSRERVRQGRDPMPSGVVIDSQSVKTTEKGDPRGYDGAKRLNGRKRHLLVDTLGLIIRALVHPADEPDGESGPDVVELAAPHVAPDAHLWAAAAYRGEFVEWVEWKLGWAVEIVTRAQGTVGFTRQPRRWVVERTFGWLGRYRRLAKDYEEYPESSEAWVYLAMSHILLRRLAPAT